MNHKILFTLIGFGFLFSESITSQNLTEKTHWQSYLQELAEEGLSNEQIDIIYQELLDIEDNPIDLNTVNADQLERIPFLGLEAQASILQFVDKNRPLYSIFELRNIPQLDFNLVHMLLPLFCIKEQEKNRTVKTNISQQPSLQEIQWRFNKVFPKRSGYLTLSDSILQRYPNRVYQGEDFYTSIRYAYRKGQHLQAGLVAEKDAGEPLWKRGHTRGFDHYGFYLAIRDMGVVRSAVIGDYRLNFGQGLILNNSSLFVQSSYSPSIIRSSTAPWRHASTAETNFFRGIAGTFSWKQTEVTLIYSNKKIDTNINRDSTAFTSIKDDGLHRTQLEISKKRNTNELVVGGNIQWKYKAIKLGINTLYSKFNRKMEPRLQYYNTHYFRGKENMNISCDYQLRIPALTFAGEIAMSKNGSFANIHSLNFSPHSQLLFSIAFRSYARAYQALYANALGINSLPNNEKGWYIAGSLYPIDRLKTSFYADIAKFDEPRFGVQTSSKAKTFFIRNDWSLSQQLKIESRYHLRQREKSERYPTAKEYTVLPNSLQKMLLSSHLLISPKWSTRTTIDYTMFKTKYMKKEHGKMISQLLSWNPTTKQSIHFFTAYFDADSYSVRVYSRERSAYPSFFSPSFYGKGMRYALSGRSVMLQNKLTIATQVNLSQYFNRNPIGSGLESINGSHRWDFAILLKYRM